MNISSQVVLTDGSNVTEVETFFAVDVVTLLLCFPTNCYVIWLIVTGTGNGLAAEFFSLNLSICEIFFCIQCLLAILEYKWKIFQTFVYFIDGLSITSLPLFQCLICVERYLAVVHPVIFLKFKPLRYRLICCVFVWVLGFISCCVSITALLFSTFIYFVFVCVQFFFFFSLQLFCLVSVLRALKQSGPGDRNREKVEENHMKRRAFYLILITTVTMLILYVPYITLLTPLWITARKVQRLTSISNVSFALAGLVQPLLFLYRVGKLPFVKCKTFFFILIFKYLLPKC